MVFGIPDLFKSGVGELQHIYNSHKPAVRLHDRQIQITTNCMFVSNSLRTISEILTVHLFQRIVNRHSGLGNVWMRGHHPNYTTLRRIKAGSDDAQDYILASENTSDLGMSAMLAWFHDANGCCTVLLHEFSRLANTRARANHSRLSASIHDGGKIWQGGLFAERGDVGHHCQRLRIVVYTIAKFRLNAFQCSVKLG